MRIPAPSTARAAAPAAAPAVALVAAALAAAAFVPVATRPARAQLVALPVVQSPFGGRLLAVAVDAGGGGDGLRTLGVAAALRRGGSRLTGTVGVGVVQGFATARPSFGARVAYLQPLGASGALAVAPFAGFGAVTRGELERQVERSPVRGRPPLTGGISVIPAGVGLGYRRVLAGRAVAVHLTPQGQYWRLGPATENDTATSRSRLYLRVGAGVDVAVTRTLGVTLAAEGGAWSRATGTDAGIQGLAEGPRRTLLGVAVSYALGSRRPRP